MNKPTIDNGILTISVGQNYSNCEPDVKVSIDMISLFESMDDETAKEFANVLSWDKVLQEAIDRLTGDSFTAGDMNPITLDVLCRLEKNCLSGYKWNMLDELRTEFKNRTSHEQLYWKLYHPDKSSGLEHTIDGMPAFQWFRENGIKSHYTTGTADDLLKHVDERLTAFAAGVPDGEVEK